ncbi:MAG: aminopeptidase N [Desulfuromonadales bacterium]|nr:aminopeptidase N [Desulfuromonadales bacterium]MBN2792162.1 aminopeptidase N [Desulfuromonadales bacterium]
MEKDTPETIYLKDYTTPAYLVDQVDLLFQLEDNTTCVTSRLNMRLNPDRRGTVEPLVLDGEELILTDIKLDGRTLSPEDYLVDRDCLRLEKVPQEFELIIQTQIDPANNTALEGLYLSAGNYCTQCEAEGFRRITYYPDRPDVLAKFRVRIEAHRKYPVLLSNGNLIEQGDLPNDRHFALWEDPFRKPSYLFALVAGDLVCLEDRYVTMSGRNVLLQIYVEERNRDFCAHAMTSLKKSMMWDEKTFGLEYDLDRYMIVAVDDFNMGAMENKGLNIFNSKYVLAHPETATDGDYLGVESVIGHEYFHNWTGNRVTCRDWFQLSLKEGLTVFRDQEFSAEMNSAAVKRIDDVRVLRQFQFPEDAGPMAHPVRPSSYVEINNFYTTTVYNKGAEVIRMMQTLLGREAFIAGVKLYLRRHDGEAATCDDFVAAMEETGGKDLQRFKRWYSQSGTPEVKIDQSYDAKQKTLTLTVTQSCSPTPGQEHKQPFHIPLLLGFMDRQGRELNLSLESGEPFEGLLELQEQVESFTFVKVAENPVISPLREFSAPVKIINAFSDEDLALRMASDSDAFNRWEAGQDLAVKELLRAYHRQDSSAPVLQPLFIESWGRALADKQVDKSLLSQLLTLPSEQYLADQLDHFDPEKIRLVRTAAERQLASVHFELLLERYRETAVQGGEFSLSPAAVGQRSLKNFCVRMIMTLDQEQGRDLATEQYRSAQNMTDRLAALAAMGDSDADQRRALLDDFYRSWKSYPLLLDKWFSLQALSQRHETFTEVERLLEHPDFTLRNPNRTRALLGAFCQNLAVFHRADGLGYRLLVDQIVKLDRSNPQIAARLAAPLTRWKRLEPQRRNLMKQELDILQQSRLSKDLFEIVAKSLA